MNCNKIGTIDTGEQVELLNMELTELREDLRVIGKHYGLAVHALHMNERDKNRECARRNNALHAFNELTSILNSEKCARLSKETKCKIFELLNQL